MKDVASITERYEEAHILLSDAHRHLLISDSFVFSAKDAEKQIPLERAREDDGLNKGPFRSFVLKQFSGDLIEEGQFHYQKDMGY